VAVEAVDKDLVIIMV
jgi:hypothetical protein